ncbi:guanidinobutyrase [Diutina catenulata]
MKTLLALALAVVSAADQIPLEFNSSGTTPLEDRWGSLWPFQGINTFAHLEHTQCLVNPHEQYDVAVIGVPFDTAVSYRSGARFGPRAIRAASQRQTSLRGYSHRAHFNPYNDWARVVDCGDIPVTPMDNKLAFEQMTAAFDELLLNRHPVDSQLPPRYVILGGDHSVILPHLRALNKAYGQPVNMIHFDAHMDTWLPTKYPSYWTTEQAELNHGSMLWKAHQEGLTTDTCIHAGLRSRLSGIEDYEDDDAQDYHRIESDAIWTDGVDAVAKEILATVDPKRPTYISVDIDVLDPGNAPGTGTQEPGGWLPRELIYVLRAIDSLHIVGADVVEVAPAYDHAEITATNGAQVAYELLTSMVKNGKVPKKFVKAKRRGVAAAHIARINELKQEKEAVERELREMMG